MKYFGKSDKGKTRDSNQDSYAVVENISGDFLGVVCDGIGGSRHGEVASSLAVEEITTRFNECKGFIDLEDAKAWLFTSVNAVNEAVYKKSLKNEEYRGMGTTFVACLICEFGTLVANVGDSRAYALYDEMTFRTITKDHTFVANLVQSGEISIQESLNHPQRHVITNAVGIWDKITVDVDEVENNTKTIVLCSDGLHGYVSEDKITNVIKEDRTLEEKANILLQMANDEGGLDNITVVLVEANRGEWK